MVSHPTGLPEVERSTNSQAEVNQRAELGQVTWPKALSVLCGRSVLAIAAQAITAGILVLNGAPLPWNAAAPWWSVYATLVDLGCLMLMASFTRTEGIGLRDLIGRIRWTRDPFLGIAWFLVVFPFFWRPPPSVVGWCGARRSRTCIPAS